MSEIKWIKITTGMFEHDKLDFIMSLPEADSIIVVWIRLLTLAGKCNAGGYVLLTESIAYTEEMLAHKFRKSPSVLKLALETLKRLKMVDWVDGALKIANWEKHQNVEGMDKVREYERLRKAKQRKAKTEALPESGGASPGNVPDMSMDSPGDVRVQDVLDLDLERTTTTEPLTLDRIHMKVFGSYSMNGLMQEFVIKLKSMGYTDVFIIELMLETGESGNKPSIRLMETIFERWSRENIFTRSEAKRRRDAEKLRAVPDRKKEDPELAARHIEIARNKWIAGGGDPDEFQYDPSA